MLPAPHSTPTMRPDLVGAEWVVKEQDFITARLMGCFLIQNQGSYRIYRVPMEALRKSKEGEVR